MTDIDPDAISCVPFAIFLLTGCDLAEINAALLAMDEDLVRVDPDGSIGVRTQGALDVLHAMRYRVLRYHPPEGVDDDPVSLWARRSARDYPGESLLVFSQREDDDCAHAMVIRDGIIFDTLAPGQRARRLS